MPLGIRTSIDFSNSLSNIGTANVGGLLPGSDPQLTKQLVVLSAHHDHFGIGKPDATGDRIYHGAVDNALGCAQVLAAARAFVALPQHTRRSLLVLFVAAEEQQQMAPPVQSPQRDRERSPLSQREREIVALVAQGFKNKEMAEKMFISEQTVKNHLHNIFDKLGVSDRLELALYAIHNNLHTGR